MQEDVLFRRDIFLHASMDVEMIRREIRHDGDVTAPVQIHQLKRAELQHDRVRRLHLVGTVEQRRADVAAQPDLAPGVAQHLGDQCRRGGLAVRAGHADDPAGADLKKRLHLGGDLRPGCAQRTKLGLERMQTRRAERDVACDPGQIALTQMQRQPGTLQLEHLVVERLARRLVAADRLDAVAQQQPHQRPIAHAQPQNQHAFAAQFLKIFL